MAAMVTRGDRYSRARNTFEVTQNSRYLDNQKEDFVPTIPYKQKVTPAPFYEGDLAARTATQANASLKHTFPSMSVVHTIP